MTIFQALILSAIEGLTEFLPISSTGHLILANRLLNISATNFTKSFNIIIQLGAILAVSLLYSKKLYSLKTWLGKIIVAFIPTVVVGFLVYPLIKSYLLNSATIVVWALGLGGLAILLFESAIKKKPTQNLKNISELSYKEAFIIGCCQTIAFIPGVSRSAATIIGGLVLGMKRPQALEFSFLLAIPTMVAASALDLIKSGFSFTASEWQILAVGLVGSFVFGILSVRWLVSYVSAHSFTAFGWYRLIVAVIFAVSTFYL